MGKKSKTKGASAERVVCKLLSNWWNFWRQPIDEEPFKFERTPLSGGWAKGSGKQFGTGADIVCSDPDFPFSVEVKRREGWSEDNFFAGKKSPVWKWINQCETQAMEANKYALLFFRKNRMEWHVAFPAYIASPAHLTPRWKITVPDGEDIPVTWNVLTAEEFLHTMPSDWTE